MRSSKVLAAGDSHRKSGKSDKFDSVAVWNTATDNLVNHDKHPVIPNLHEQE
jgi:hypothetical protein